ncbi:MAG: response regulator [Candidatus Cloacimonetes bacterium]|nr:response regulator [Candidatus Cloacimonadota bacterium]
MLVLTGQSSSASTDIMMLSLTQGIASPDIINVDKLSTEEFILFIEGSKSDLILLDYEYFCKQDRFGSDINKFIRDHVKNYLPYLIVFYPLHLEGKALLMAADNFLPTPIDTRVFNMVLRRSRNEQLSVLTVEDNKTLQIILNKSLEKKGYKVASVSDGLEAQEHLKDDIPDAIISDIQMDGCDGFELCQWLRKDPHLSRLPILLVSSLTDAKSIKQAFEAGASDYVTKPYDMAEIHQKLTYYISRNGSQREKILVVEDTRMGLELIRRPLESERFIVITAKNGKEGIERALNEQPDVITTDYNMPEMDGWDFCRALKSDERTSSIPVIMITGKNSDLDKKIGRTLKINDYLTKPFEAANLVSTINFLLMEKMAEEEKQARELLSHELGVGREIQRSLLPAFDPDFGDLLGLRAGWIPAKDLAGDFFDYLSGHLEDKKMISVIMADVSGKGLPSALIAVAAQACLRSIYKDDNTPLFMIERLNGLLYESTSDEMFLTCFIATIDIEKRKIAYCSGGHNGMLLYRNATNELIELDTAGLPCGMMEENIFEMDEQDIQENDKLILYTDGVDEARYKADFYGRERFLDFILDNASTMNCNELHEAIIDDINSFTKSYPQSDDITLIVVDL